MGWLLPGQRRHGALDSSGNHLRLSEDCQFEREGCDSQQASFTAPSPEAELIVLHCPKFEQGLWPRRGWSGPWAGQKNNLPAPWGSLVHAKLQGT